MMLALNLSLRQASPRIAADGRIQLELWTGVKPSPDLGGRNLFGQVASKTLVAIQGWQALQGFYWPGVTGSSPRSSKTRLATKIALSAFGKPQ